MSYGTYGGRYASSVDRHANFPQGVKWLLIVNIALFVLYFLAAHSGYQSLFWPFGLTPRWVVEGLAVWQLVSYLFLHDPYGFTHILFNMLALWMFGKDLEMTWGTKRFLQFYFVCGIGAGLCVVALNAAFGNMDSRTIGASGAIYGLLLAFGMLFPDTTVLFSFLFPIKAKYFVMIIGAIAFLSTFGSSATGGGVSHIAHLGGMVWGYLYLKSGYLKLDLFGMAQRRYQQWKLDRAKRKFKVYLRKRDSGSDRNRWVH